MVSLNGDSDAERRSLNDNVCEISGSSPLPNLTPPGTDSDEEDDDDDDDEDDDATDWDSGRKNHFFRFLGQARLD